MLPLSCVGTCAFWFAIIGFCAGVLLRSLLPYGESIAWCFISIASALALAGCAARRAPYALAGVACLACAAGVLRMDAATTERVPALDALVGEEISLEGVVFAEPDAREATTRLFVDARSLESRGAPEPISARLLVVAAPHVDAAYGDRVRIRGVLHTPQSFETGPGRSFDYPGYLAKEGVLYEVAFAEVERIGAGEKNPLKAAAVRAKQLFLEGLAYTLPEPHAGLAGGITAGDKRGLGEELSKVFRTVGLTHIVVLSGYNIMVVVDALARAGARVPPWMRFGGGGVVAVFFALMTGLASASVRAAAMAIIALLGRATGRTYLASRALGAVSVGMVLWNPYVLAFDIGFQLSVVATWGLIALSPLFERYFAFLPKRGGLREIAVATVSTQCAVLPLLLYQSGELSVVSFPANLLVLAAVPWAMAFSAVAGVAGMLLGAYAVPFALLAYALLSYIIGVADLFASLPFASISLSSFGVWWVAGAYAILGVFAYQARERRSV